MTTLSHSLFLTFLSFYFPNFHPHCSLGYTLNKQKIVENSWSWFQAWSCLYTLSSWMQPPLTHPYISAYLSSIQNLSHHPSYSKKRAKRVHTSLRVTIWQLGKYASASTRAWLGTLWDFWIRSPNTLMLFFILLVIWSWALHPHKI